MGPTKVVAGRRVQLFETSLVSCQKDEGVPVRAVGSPTLFGGLLRELLRYRFGTTLVGDLRVQDDQPRLVRVGDVSVRFGADVNASEVAAGSGLALDDA